MNSAACKSCGVFLLACGFLLLAQSAKRLRADPLPGICPHVLPSSATKACEVNNLCDSTTDKTKCLKADTFYSVVTFPKECLKSLPDTQDKLCNEENKKCMTFLRCKYDEIDFCYEDPTQPGVPAYENRLKLIAGDCP